MVSSPIPWYHKFTWAQRALEIQLLEPFPNPGLWVLNNIVLIHKKIKFTLKN